MNYLYCIKSRVDYWLYYPTIVTPSALCSTYVSEHYLNLMNESDTDLRKAIRDKETALELSMARKMGTNKKKGLIL